MLPFFEFRSEPFSRLVGSFRRQIFEEVAASDLPGFIVTRVWALHDPSDHAYIGDRRDLFARQRRRTVFVESWADLDTRLARNRTDLRLRAKPSKCNVEASEARLLDAEKRYRMSSDRDFPFDGHLRIDNSDLEPDEVARRIAQHFSPTS